MVLISDLNAGISRYRRPGTTLQTLLVTEESCLNNAEVVTGRKCLKKVIQWIREQIHAIILKERALIMISCQVLHEFCEIIFMDQMCVYHKIYKIYIPLKFRDLLQHTLCILHLGPSIPIAIGLAKNILVHNHVFLKLHQLSLKNSLIETHTGID